MTQTKRFPQAERVLVIGLDSVSPELAFDAMLPEMPHLHALLQRSTYGPMESTIPPITVPAWACMMTSQDPGQLGLYGFRNRGDYSYQLLRMANSQAIQSPRVWDLLSEADRQVIVVGVPQTYPASPVNGHLITGFLTPGAIGQYTYPPSLQQEIREVVGEYPFDVPNYRTENKKGLLEALYHLLETQFIMFRHLLHTKPWQFAMIVAMAPDRFHHGFWRFYDPQHPHYEAQSPFADAFHEFYAAMDREIGRTLELVDDKTAVLIVSDHGIKRMEGGICINEWLIQEGYLTLEEPPTRPVPLSRAKVNWSQTQVWGEGGYYARVFLNVKGREPEGTIPPEDYEKVRDELIAKLTDLKGPDGQDIGTRVFKPQAIYRACRGIPPDLIVHFGDLYWRSIGSVGLNTIYTTENDTGPDDANHSQHGIFVLAVPGASGRGWTEGIHILDVAPTVLACLGLDPPPYMQGKVITP